MGLISSASVTIARGDWAAALIVLLVGWPLVGAVLVINRPKNGIGRLMVVFACLFGISMLAETVVALGNEGVPVPGFDLFTWLALVVITPVMTVVVLLIAYFPSGKVESEWLRWPLRVLVGVTVLGVAVRAILPVSMLSGDTTITNPWGIETLAPLVPLDGLGFGVVLVVLALAAVDLVVRWRRSTGVVRLQMRALALAIGWFAFGVAFSAALALAGLEEAQLIRVENVAWVLGLAAFPVAIGVAVLQYRLYDVDLVINRTVVFVVLVGFIAVVYGTVVVGVGSVLGGGGGGWASILATAVVALAFEPVRHVAQRWANRFAYGHRATPYEVLSDLTERLTGSGQGGDILDRMASLLVDGTGAERATVWLGSPGEMRPVATSGENGSGSPVDLSADTVFPVVHHGETVGALEVVKPRGMALSPQERSLMSDLAGSAGAVLGYERLNESLAHAAKEIGSSRRRLVGAEGEERKRLEEELNEGAQQLILALKVNIGLARRAAADSGSPGLVALLDGLIQDAQAALDEVHNLAKGIYPPVLESDGLGAAVSALAAGAPVEVEVSRDGIGRYSREVESAVYFDISEALTNAVKHARPPVRVTLADHEGVLRFSVSDSGPGFDPGKAREGSGLANLRDRVDAAGGKIEVRSAPGERTTIEGEIPVAGASAGPV